MYRHLMPDPSGQMAVRFLLRRKAISTESLPYTGLLHSFFQGLH